MGNRAVIQIENGDAAIYTHWQGEDAVDTIKDAIRNMRPNDASYATARLCEAFCKKSAPPTGVRILPKFKFIGTTPDENESHGDAGCIVISEDLKHVKFYHGYLAEQYPEGLDL